MALFSALFCRLSKPCLIIVIFIITNAFFYIQPTNSCTSIQGVSLNRGILCIYFVNTAFLMTTCYCAPICLHILMLNGLSISRRLGMTYFSSSCCCSQCFSASTQDPISGGLNRVPHRRVPLLSSRIFLSTFHLHLSIISSTSLSLPALTVLLQVSAA